MAQEDKELACVLIPVGEARLLLPNVSVGEILPWRRIKPLAEAPAWCLGVFGWRGETLPVVRFEGLNAPDVPAPRSGRCLIVMNRARSRTGRAFYALAADGLPRLVYLTANDLENQSRRLGAAEVAAVKVGTEAALVPNLTYVEEQLGSVGTLIP